MEPAVFVASPGSPFGVGKNPVSLAVGDFNGDGKADLATANFGGSTVTILLNSLATISASPASLTFYAGAGLAAPGAIPVSVNAATTGSTYTASSNESWLTPAPLSNATGGATTEHLSASAAPSARRRSVYPGDGSASMAA